MAAQGIVTKRPGRPSQSPPQIATACAGRPAGAAGRLGPGSGAGAAGYQDSLIQAVAAANPNTAVVLNTGDPMLMPWASSVKSILEMSYPGEEGGRATADVLLGKADPGGKLPVTFPFLAGATT
jgi:beta-glucosidase